MNNLLLNRPISKNSIVQKVGISRPTLNTILKNKGTIHNYKKVLKILKGEFHSSTFQVTNDLGSDLKTIRKSAKYSQDVLSKKIGITQANLSNIESNANGRVSTIFDIFNACGHKVAVRPKSKSPNKSLKQIIKNTKNNGILKITTISKQTAKDWTLKYHYSKNWNKTFGIVNYGIFKDDKLMGIAVYGHLMNPKSHKNICNYGSDSILELNRLHLSDQLKHNAESLFLSATFKLIRANHREVKFIHTFADGRLGCGTIYKASNFKYYGYHISLFFEDIETGEIHHKIRLENIKNSQRFMNSNRLFLDGRLKAFTVKTYRYIYSLYGDPVKLQEQPYPAYDKGLTYLQNYKHPIGILARLRIMYDAIQDFKYISKVDSLLQSYGYSADEIELEMVNQGNNASLKNLLQPRLVG